MYRLADPEARALTKHMKDTFEIIAQPR
jgi:hypothetical protein